MSERSVLASCFKSRAAFEKVAKSVEKGDFTDQGGIIYNGCVEYYTADGSAEKIDPDLLARLVGRGITNPKHKDTFGNLIRIISEEPVSPANVVNDFIAVKREACGHRLASALASATDMALTSKLLDEYQEWQDAETLGDEEVEDTLYCGMSIRDLAENIYNPDDLIKVYPKALNDRLDGGCLRGHHVVVFARPETGKTMFLVNSIAGFLQQGLDVLYLGNEDPIPDIILRVATRLTGRPKFDALADPDGTLALMMERGYGKLKLKQLTPGTPREIDRLCAEHKPDVLLIDQLRNIQVKEDNFTQQLEKAARAVRTAGQKHQCLVVSVTQAGESASGKAVLGMGDVDSSNTGIPAQADVMIGIGMTADDQASGRRVLSLCKNKRSGKHDFFPVGVEPHVSKINSMA